MLILCSNGLSSDMLLSQLSSKVVDCKTAALVVTADNEYKENNYHVPRCVAELQSLNLNVDISCFSSSFKISISVFPEIRDLSIAIYVPPCIDSLHIDVYIDCRYKSRGNRQHS